MQIKIQIERKFLVEFLPNLSSFKKVEIQQWYLPNSNPNEETRVRKYGDGSCYIDVIVGKGKKREKCGRKTDWDKFKDRNMDNLPSVIKTRYKKKIDNVLMCVDVFDTGLQLVEIESYDSEFAIDRFVKPSWFGKEVTDEIEYTNKWIAEKNS